MKKGKNDIDAFKQINKQKRHAFLDGCIIDDHVILIFLKNMYVAFIKNNC